MEKNTTRRLIIWDLLMVLVASANLFLIVFDLSYFRLRPLYLEYIPPLQEAYDKIKGIEPHRSTEAFLADIAQLEYLLSKAGKERSDKILMQRINSLKLNLTDQMHEIIEENPFEGAGLTKNLQQIKKRAKDFAREKLNYEGDSSKESFEIIFSQDNESTRQMLNSWFLIDIEPYFQENYYRHLGLDGKPFDNFFYLDLPFLLFFLFEFLGRWFYSVRKNEYPYRFLFLIYRWYDVLGLLPYQATRIFRLFRIVTIIQRLKELKLLNIGEGPISKFVKNLINIIVTDVTDRVTVQLLDRAQEQIQGRDSSTAILNAIEPQKEAIIENSRRILASSLGASYNHQLRKLLAESLEESSRRVPSLVLVPDILKETLTREIGLAVYDSITDAFQKNLSTPGRDNLIEQVADYITNQLLDEDQQNDLRDMLESLTIQIIENLKNQSTSMPSADST